MDDKVSIVVPVYQSEKYLDICVKSLINQTYQNIEIILVDDGSTDSSSKKCEEWAKKDRRIVTLHKENGGIADARNTGLSIIHGKYVCFVDSDDYVSTLYIEMLHNALEVLECDVAVCQYISGGCFDNTAVTSQILTKKEMIRELCVPQKNIAVQIKLHQLILLYIFIELMRTVLCSEKDLIQISYLQTLHISRCWINQAEISKKIFKLEQCALI